MIVSTLSMMEGNGMAAYIILLALGIIFVVKGGDWFVDAASWIAEVSGIPTFIIRRDNRQRRNDDTRNFGFEHICGARSGVYGNRQRSRLDQLQYCSYHGNLACVHRPCFQTQRLRF